MYVRRKGGYGAFPLMTEVTSIHAPKIMKEKGEQRKPHCDGMVFEALELVEKMLQE